MNRITFGYTLKNIPIPSKISYIKCFICKYDDFSQRCRWKAYFFDKKQKDNNSQTNQSNLANDYAKLETFGFPTENTAPYNNELAAFEQDVFNLMKNAEYDDTCTPFQRKLAQDVKSIRNNTHVLVSADKTTNIYQLTPDEYSKLFTDNVTANYKISQNAVKRSIDLEAKRIAKDLNLSDRIESLAKREAFITLKDHKDNFVNDPKCRLLNPAKSEIGIVSRAKLQEINSIIRQATRLNQWRNSSTVINWFTELNEKKSTSFIQFDIVDFYPSITEVLLNKSIEYAKSITNIEDETISIIMNSRKSLLFANDKVWTKKNGELFDVTMGSHDGAETCELVDLFILSNLKQKFPNIDFGLYRDDGLGAHRRIPGPELERTRKSIIQFFKSIDLKITISTNLSIVNFLDFTLNLKSEKYYPFKKENSELLYINVDSNHPPTIVKQIPTMIEKRLSELSHSAVEFNEAKRDYEKALRESGFKANLEFKKSPPARRKRTRNIIWFNPPFNIAVKDNIGKRFLALLDKHFPPSHKYHKIFNRNTVKLSYSCTPNLKSIISSHNKRILRREPSRTEAPCNCRDKPNCPLPSNGECRLSAVVYKATVTSSEGQMDYIGISDSEIKLRISNHKNSMKYESKRNSTRLSQYVWNLKEKNIPHNIKWEILSKTKSYQPGSKTCDLCNSEKWKILTADPEKTLNKRTEIMNKCRHKTKFKLANVK